MNNAKTIRNEDDAYELLASYYDDQAILREDFEIKFDGWPVLEIKISGDKFSSTITPTVMKGLIDFQKAIYRSYALSKYNSFNINKLTKSEKDDLEIQVKVSKGSSHLGIDFQAALEKFMMGLANKMEPTQIVIIILGIALLYFGHSALRMYLQGRKETRLSEIKSKEAAELIASQKFASEQETKKMEIIAGITNKNKVMGNAKAYAYEAHTGLLKSVKSADSAELQGIEIGGDVAEELVKNARKKAIEVRLDGEYRILAVDATNKDGFKVKIMDTGTLDKFNALVQDKTLDNKYKQIIQEAEWSKSPVKLVINARDVGGEIRGASILSADKVDATNHE